MSKRLIAQNLSVGYGGESVLTGADFTLVPGELLALIGPNGGGKSTLLKTLARQLAPIAGAVYLDRRELGKIPGAELARRMSVLLTERVAAERMDCSEVVSTGRYPYTGRLGILSREDWRKVEEAMMLMGVSDLAHRPFVCLSDGQRQRVMVARALCQEPQVLLLDEPTAYLDIRHKLELLSLLNRLARQRQMAVVLSLHELDLAQMGCDRVLCVGNGTAGTPGRPETIFTEAGIRALYDLPPGSYDPRYASLSLPAPPGPPEVFVIGGGGLGIPVYRALQRRGIPFAAGVIHENDLDCPAARALAAELITERAFEPISEEAIERVKAVLKGCQELICCPERFGSMNEGNRRLLEWARERVPCQSAKQFLTDNE